MFFNCLYNSPACYTIKILEIYHWFSKNYHFSGRVSQARPKERAAGSNLPRISDICSICKTLIDWLQLILRCGFSNYFSHFFPAMKKKTKQSPYGAKRSRFTAVFCSNVSIISACIVLIFQIISIGTTMWYVSQDDIIKYVHGGLWNICMGEINRTFCSYRSYTPGKNFLYFMHLQNDT